MAVTIDEMQVEMRDTAPQAAAAPAESKPESDVQLRSALEMLRERKSRLQAD